jgi:hypothetical protein
MYFTPETLLNHVFEDLRKPKAPNNRLPKNKIHLVDMSTLLILLSFGLGYRNPRGQDITIQPP